MGNTALHAYLETADPIDSDTAIALLDIELAEAAQGAAPEHDINCGIDPLHLGENIGCTCWVGQEAERAERDAFEGAAPRAEGHTVDECDPWKEPCPDHGWPRGAPRAEGLALDFDSASALLSAYNYWLNDNPDATVGDRYDWTKRYLARLRPASPLNASGDER